MRHPGLTVRQAEVLSAVRDWIALHGHSPTSRELGPIIGIAHQGAQGVLAVLERKGCLHRGGKDGRRTPDRTLRLAGPTPGPAGVHLASAVVAYEDGVPAGVAYQVTAAEVEQHTHWLECPCCGDVGAYGEDEGRLNLCRDGQELVCGCEGQVVCDAETPASVEASYCGCQDPDLQQGGIA